MRENRIAKGVAGTQKRINTPGLHHGTLRFTKLSQETHGWWGRTTYYLCAAGFEKLCYDVGWPYPDIRKTLWLEWWSYEPPANTAIESVLGTITRDYRNLCLDNKVYDVTPALATYVQSYLPLYPDWDPHQGWLRYFQAND